MSIGRARDRSRARGGGAPAAFTPAALPSPAAWWRSDSGITIATGVSNWADRTSNARDVAQGTGSAQPARNLAALNGQPELQFTAASAQSLGRADLCGVGVQAVRTLWCVARLEAAATRTQLMSQGQSGSANNYVGFDANTAGTLGSQWGLFFPGGSSYDAGASDAAYHLHVLVVSNATIGGTIASTVTYYVDGVARTMTLVGGTGLWVDMTGAAATNLGVFAGVAPTGSCRHVEAGVHAAALSAGDVAALYAYCKARYGI